MPVHVGKDWPLLKAITVEKGIFSRNYSQLQSSGPLANQERFGGEKALLPNKSKGYFIVKYLLPYNRGFLFLKRGLYFLPKSEMLQISKGNSQTFMPSPWVWEAFPCFLFPSRNLFVVLFPRWICCIVSLWKQWVTTRAQFFMNMATGASQIRQAHGHMKKIRCPEMLFKFLPEFLLSFCFCFLRPCFHVVE